MRKFLIRWWYRPSWQADRLMQAIREVHDRDFELPRPRRPPDLLEMYDQLEVALERLRYGMPYTGSGDLFDPYSHFILPTGNGTPLGDRE